VYMCNSIEIPDSAVWHSAQGNGGEMRTSV
jgi:hypothetical protein